MVIVGLIGSILYSLASVAMAYRLLLQARRTRELPELFIGTAFLTGGAMANTFSWLAWVVPVPMEWRPLLPTLNSALYAVSCFSLVLAAWRVFRPKERWAAFLAGLITASLIPYIFWELLTGPSSGSFGYVGPATSVRNGLYWSVYAFGATGLAVSYGWFSVECLLLRLNLGRRRRLGLRQDVLLENRLTLWAMGLGCVAVTWAFGPFARLVREAFEIPMSSRLVAPVLLLTCSFCLWLAFFPPEPYRRWVRRRFGRGRPSPEGT